jgi:hypothetical protein
MKRYLHLLNIILALILVSQIRAWLVGPYSGYLFMRTFLGLVLVCSGAYQFFRWNKYGTVRKGASIAGFCIGLALLFDYEPVSSLLR